MKSIAKEADNREQSVHDCKLRLAVGLPCRRLPNGSSVWQPMELRQWKTKILAT